MKSNLLTLIITLVVGVILAGSMLAPAISDAATDDHTGTNAYYTRMSEIGDSTITLSYDTANSKPLFNSEEFNFTNSNGTTANNVAIISDSFTISTTGTMWYYYFVYDDADQTIYSAATGANTAVATIGGGSMNLYINDSLSFDLPYTFCYIPDNSGDFVMCQEHFNGFFDKNDNIVVSQTNRTNHGVASGTIDALVTHFHATDNTVDTDTYTFEAVYDTETVGITDLCKTQYDSFRYILPYEYHYETNNEYAGLYSAILVIAIAGLLIIATSSIIMRRD